MQIEIQCQIEKIISRNKTNCFTVAKVKIYEHTIGLDMPATAEPIIVGTFSRIRVNDQFVCKGRWINHAKYGYQFEVDSYRLELSEEEKGIIEFLSKFVRGVGEVTATRVVEEFGNNTYNVIINKPEDLLAIGITETKARAMHKAMLERKKYEELFSFLIPLGWSHEDIFFIYKNLGYYAIEKIKKNPYILCNYKELEFEKVDNLAKHLGFNENNLERLKQSIMIYISRQVDGNGDMFVYKKNIIREVPDFLDASGAFKETKLDQLEDAIEELVISKKIVIEKDNNGEECVYIRFYAHIENSIAKKISRMIRQKPTTIPTKEMIEVSIKQYESNQGLKLASGQKNAIFMCLENKLSILNGGPGTGKSQTIDAIIACIKEVQPGADIQLCAPTGRAAKRMTELTGMEAKTIHRLIGLNNFKQDRKELIEIEADFLIIDEASMIDAYVFYSLLSAISSHTKILIVGDYEQLPSVGAGLILRDLINSKVIPITILTEIFRQNRDSQIVLNSQRIIKGGKELSLKKEKKDFYFIPQPNKDYILDIILLSIDRLLQTGFRLEDIQVLSVMNDGDLGVDELNKRIQERFNPKYPAMPQLQISHRRCLRVNDRVMQTVNNYDLSIFNGEIGVVVDMDMTNYKDIRTTIDFSGKKVVYDLGDVKELELAYAVTVFKAQGSEFDVVIMPFHSSLKYLLNRSTIYTGWTRAKKRVICVGDEEELNKGIGRVENNVRNSRLIEKIREETRE